ncbi:MAG: hypothetical protein IKK77_05070 [Clostridia bacterium]|nr:hypothetical protein [Clostridia bacterium]
MKRLVYIIKRIFKMDYKNMLDTVGFIHKKTNKSKIWLFCDMVKCGLKYGAGYKDYKLAEFYNLNNEQRATYVTRGINNTIVSMLNSREYYHIFENKTEFNTVFKDFIGRKWLDMTTASLEEFKGFMSEMEVIISKPLDATCGQGVMKLHKKDFENDEALFSYLKESGSGLIEECVVQHPLLSAIYPHSVNTYRIVTVLSEGKPNVVYAFIRIGNGGRFVDNINSGGMAAPINIETGIIEFPAFDKDSIYYDVHPETNCKIKGYELPFWKESVALATKAATVVEQVGYVGWDVAVTEQGPLIIEGNHFPGHDILQMPPHVPDKIGMLPTFKKYIKGL